MRQVMANAEVGDDVVGEDPTVARLEATAAEMLGKENSLLIASAATNTLPVNLHTRIWRKAAARQYSPASNHGRSLTKPTAP